MSIKKIAELAGTSSATVSRVLNHPEYHCHDAQMEKKIHDLARELHYVPNQAAKQLKSTATEREQLPFEVDVLMARFNTLEMDPFFHEVFRNLQTELLHQNLVLGKIVNVPDVSLMKARKERTTAQGLIIMGKCPAGLVGELQQRYSAIIAIDRNPMEYSMDEVVCDGAKAAQMAVEYLIELGHSRIAYVGDCNMEARYTGYYECLQKHQIKLTYDYVVSTSQTREEGYRAFEQLAKLQQQPTAVFCANDVTAIGLLQAMKEKNGKRKKHIYSPAVVSIDDIEEAVQTKPMLTTVRMPKEDLVHLAVLTLVDRLNKGHSQYIRLELPCQLMIRETSGIYIR